MANLFLLTAQHTGTHFMKKLFHQSKYIQAGSNAYQEYIYKPLMIYQLRASHLGFDEDVEQTLHRVGVRQGEEGKGDKIVCTLRDPEAAVASAFRRRQQQGKRDPDVYADTIRRGLQQASLLIEKKIAYGVAIDHPMGHYQARHLLTDYLFAGILDAEGNPIGVEPACEAYIQAWIPIHTSN